MIPLRREARGIALRLVFWLPVLLGLAWRWETEYAHLLMPLYHTVLGLLLHGFSFVDMELYRSSTEYLFKIQYSIETFLVVGQGMISPGTTGYTQAPTYYALVHPVILDSAALAWPGLTWRGRIARILISLPFLFVLEVLDVPMVLFSSIQGALAQGYDPFGAKPVDWSYILEGGGRYALCILAAFAAAELHKLSFGQARDRLLPAG